MKWDYWSHPVPLADNTMMAGLRPRIPGKLWIVVFVMAVVLILLRTCRV